MVNVELLNSASWQQGRVAVTDGYLAYHRRKTSGPALIFSHGLADNGLCWGRLIGSLPRQLDLILLDARGHGASTRNDGATSVDPASDIAEAMTGLAIGRAMLIGHSVGALASAAFAARWPERSCALIMEDPPLLPQASEAEVAERRERFHRQVSELQALDDAAIASRGREQSPAWHAEEFPAWTQAKRQVDPAAWPVSNQPWQDIFGQINCPALMLCGESSLGSLVSPESSAAAAMLNPNLRMARISGAGHNVRRENLVAFAAAVNDFLVEQIPEIAG